MAEGKGGGRGEGGRGEGGGGKGGGRVLSGYVHAVTAVSRLPDTVTRWLPSFRVEMIKLKGSVTCGEVGVGLLLHFLSSMSRQLYRVTTGLDLRRGGRDGNSKNELFVKREPVTEM